MESPEKQDRPVPNVNLEVQADLKDQDLDLVHAAKVKQEETLDRNAIGVAEAQALLHAMKWDQGYAELYSLKKK